MDWRVLLLVVGYLLATSGCTCAYKVADREIVLERGVRNEDVEAALNRVSSIQDIRFYPEERYRVWFVFPARDPASFYFRTPGRDSPFGGISASLHHFDGSPKLNLRAQTINRKPKPQDQMEAHLLFFEIEEQLRRRIAQANNAAAVGK